MPFADVVLARLEELGLNVNQAELRAGLPQGYIRGVVRADSKRSTPNFEKAAEIAQALDLEFYFGPRRETGPVEVTEIDGHQFTPVRRFDVELSAGNGAENGDAQVSEMLAFRHDWLKRVGVSPSNACLVKVRGESMQPTLHDGDLVLIDQSKTKIRSGRIYAFNDGGHSKVKRLDCMDDQTLIIRSDNPQFPLDIRKGEDANALKVIGEVVWSGHTFG